MPTSVRVAPFVRAWSDAELDAAVSRRAAPIHLGAMPAETAAERFGSAASDLFVPTAQVRLLLRTILRVCAADAEARYQSDQAFRQGLYSLDPWGGKLAPALCLTGLAGVGKSQLLLALGRLLASGPATYSISGIDQLPLRPLWQLSGRDGFSTQVMLAEVLGLRVDDVEPEGPAGRPRPRSPKNILGLARRLAWRDAVSLITTDEFQFIAQSSPANARATTLLLSLSGIGPRLLFCGNFSLLHKLARRNAEDRQRLLQKPIVLQPDEPNDADWLAYLTALRTIDPESFAFDVAAVQEEVHRYTFGIRRLVVMLLKLAYQCARRKSARSAVDSDMIRRAYCSSEYTANREDVECLWRQHVKQRMIRPDLWYPFSAEPDDHPKDPGTETPDPREKVTALNAAIEARKGRVDAALLESSMTPDEKAALEAIEGKRQVESKPSKVVGLPRRRVTKDDLLAGAKELDSM